MKAITFYAGLLLCASPLTMGFQYQTNDVFFDTVGDSPYSVAGVVFYWTDFSITSGQDPDHRFPQDNGQNARGWSPNDQGSCGLQFIAGRHASSSVSSWWQQHFVDSETTFNDHPEALNFAVIGTLKFLLQQGSTSTWLTIPNVGLGQGHDANGNNWWFAIQGAEQSGGYSGNDDAIVVEVQGKQYEFFRGVTHGGHQSGANSAWGNLVNINKDENPICTNPINQVRVRVLDS